MAPDHRLRAMIKIVGVDPGLSATGVGVIRGQGFKVTGYSFGCITTSQGWPLPERLDRIFSRLLALLSEETPDLVVVEDVFSLKEYPKSGISLGQVSGVVILAASRAGVRCAEIPVREAKQALTGNGNASKVQLEGAVRRHLRHPEPIRPHHASDALGLAIIGLFRCGGVSPDDIGFGRRCEGGAAGRFSELRKRKGNPGLG
jgi:crossover junction endodeoxyribonuclease RuvC